MFQNRLQKIILGPAGEEYWINFEVRIFIICYYADHIKKNEMEGHVERMER
jgi:hypothetical protein